MGTPIGTLLVMKPCSISISTKPKVRLQPPGAKSKTSGTAISSAVPTCPTPTASREGRRSSGKLRYTALRIQGKRVKGLLLVITQTTVGK